MSLEILSSLQQVCEIPHVLPVGDEFYSCARLQRNAELQWFILMIILKDVFVFSPEEAECRYVAGQLAPASPHGMVWK